MSEAGYAHWRNSMKPARLGPLDGRSAIPLLFLLLHFRLWTLGVTIIIMLIFWAFERRGLTFPAALRAIRVWLLGPRRPAIMFTRRRRMTDVQDWVPDFFGGATGPAPAEKPAAARKPAAGKPAAARPRKPQPAKAALEPGAPMMGLETRPRAAGKTE